MTCNIQGDKPGPRDLNRDKLFSPSFYPAFHSGAAFQQLAGCSPYWEIRRPRQERNEGVAVVLGTEKQDHRRPSTDSPGDGASTSYPFNHQLWWVCPHTEALGSSYGSSRFWIETRRFTQTLAHLAVSDLLLVKVRLSSLIA